jgi:hypothetical protein
MLYKIDFIGKFKIIFIVNEIIFLCYSDLTNTNFTNYTNISIIQPIYIYRYVIKEIEQPWYVGFCHIIVYISHRPIIFTIMVSPLIIKISFCEIKRKLYKYLFSLKSIECFIF